MLYRILSFLVCVLLLTGSSYTNAGKQNMSAEALRHGGAVQRVVLGVERLAEPEVQQLLQGKRLGLFTNQSGVDSNLRSSVDLVRERYNLTAIFVPEHGLFGAVAAGEKFSSHEYQKIPVLSLYGDRRRPNKEMLDKIDIMVVDIQDVGVRHYTYFSSLAYIMEECAEQQKQVVVLDRPNPLGGLMQGPVLKEQYATFIGLYPIPLRHGLTIGEFAKYINKEQKINCPLAVVPMQNYRRLMTWDDTLLPWVQTSPRIPTAETAFLYCITGSLGNGNLSVGIGTGKPFHFIGAPFMDAAQVKTALDALKLKGIGFRAAAFTPKAGAYTGELVQGVEIYVLDKRTANLPEAGYAILQALRRLYPDKLTFKERGYGLPGYKIDTNLGESSAREGLPAAEVFSRWQKECAAFAKTAQPYLLYK
ncbi:DUF1343 domain-containing protein [uncultured Phascolarctobacterium sp.]|uniref:exo-beta-N-acetylmuramidase NamZ family protein n=1 Tax=uncultured Phascolarctobacterium sp. TaxID=512296 RepID=UPI002623DEAD|nr:DUF1343 domain-containing protein [uncultured Phascolarctobacterium sp.]